jgi:hypothetical protein
MQDAGEAQQLPTSKEEAMKKIVRPLHAARGLWRRIEGVVTTQGSTARSLIRKRWRRSWVGKTAWPWLKREIEIISKVTGVVVVSLWLKRLVEQFLGKKVLNEPVLRGEVNDIVRGIEEDVEQRRPGHVRTRE